MKIVDLLLISVLVLSIQACSNSSDNSSSGTSADANTKVYDGQLIPNLEAPGLVGIDVVLIDGGHYLCSGTVIGARSVLTATHCFLAPNIATASVFVLGTFVPIIEAQPHPGFRVEEEISAIFNDVTVVKTATDLGVPAVPLMQSQPVVAGQDLTLFGYGLNEDDELGMLRGGIINVDIVTPNHIIDIASDDYQNSCQGDSGGPIILSVQNPITAEITSGVVGIVSYGTSQKCVGEGDTSYYANLQNPDLLNFILQQVPEAVVM